MKPKYLTLADKDKELLTQLHDFIYLDVAFIHKYIYTEYTGGYQSVMQRLKRLEDFNYVRKFSAPIENIPKASNIYTLTSFGVEIVEEIQGITKWNSRWSNNLLPWYQHQLMLNRIVKDFQLQAEEIGFEMKEWISETRATWQYTQEKTDVIKPDGVIIFGRPDSDKNKAFFIELERSVAKRQNTIRKVLRYNDFLNRDSNTLLNYDLHVGFEAPVDQWRVLFIGGNERNTKKTLRDIQSIHNAQLDIPLLVTSKEDFEHNAFGESYYFALSETPDEKRGL